MSALAWAALALAALPAALGAWNLLRLPVAAGSGRKIGGALPLQTTPPKAERPLEPNCYPSRGDGLGVLAHLRRRRHQQAAVQVARRPGGVRSGEGQRPSPGGAPRPSASILIPARDEATNITACIGHALVSRGIAIEVIVADDGSTDGTPAIVAALAATEPRLRLIAVPPLPPGWTGKVHACATLAAAARGSHLLFIDADVRLAPEAAAALAHHATGNGIALVSGVPRQRLGSLGEALTVPAINLLMLGYLPGGGRADSALPSLAAACGQLLLCDAAAYRATGGHAALHGLLHDGLHLARLFRARGHRTEIVDGAPLAECRMYRGLGEAWAGFLKNAREGMATPIGLPVWTALLAGGHLLPWALLPDPRAILAVALGFGLRAAIARRAREPWWSVVLHPLGVATALAIQWHALARGLAGRPAGWKGRAYPATRAA